MKVDYSNGEATLSLVSDANATPASTNLTTTTTKATRDAEATAKSATTTIATGRHTNQLSEVAEIAKTKESASCPGLSLASKPCSAQKQNQKQSQMQMQMQEQRENRQKLNEIMKPANNAETKTTADS
ncbi:hypothetical protein ACLKA6_008140 [Drosophila palustris]